VLIDRQLADAGWWVQSRPIDLLAGQGVAVREVIMAPGHGRPTTSSTSTSGSAA
jgi:type I restriction enzyme R subunit